MSTYIYADQLRFKVKSISEYFRKFPVAVKKSNSRIDFPTLLERELKFELITTTHSSPIGQKYTGWSDKHIYEIGWLGRYHVTDTTKSSTEKWFWSDKPEGFNSGSGGSGHYEFKLYLKDFPRIHEKFYKFATDQELLSLYDLVISPNKEDKILANNILNSIQGTVFKKLEKKLLNGSSFL